MNSNHQVKNIAFASVASIVKTVCQFLQVAILVRFFLDPEQFGLLAIATFVIAFSDLFLDMGLSVYIMYKHNISREQFSSLYWFGVIISIILVLILIIISPLISSFYDKEELASIIPLLSANLLFWAIGRNYRTLLEKEFRFKILAIVDTIVALVIFTIAILLAWNDFGVWSVVIANVIGVFIQNIVYLVKGFRILPLCFNLKYFEVREFLSIGLYQFAAKLLDFFSSQSDILIVGKLLGLEVLGVYNIVRQIIYSLGGFLNNGFNAVMPPIFVKAHKDEVLLRESFFSYLGNIILINTICFVGLAFSSETALWVVYGSEFVIGGWLLTCLACMYAINTIGNPVSALIICKGRTDIAMYWTVYRLAISLVALFLGASYSIEGVALALFAVALFNIYPYYRFVYSKMQKSVGFNNYFIAIRPVVVSSILIVSVKYFLRLSGTIDEFLYITIFMVFLLIYLYFESRVFRDIVKRLMARCLVSNN